MDSRINPDKMYAPREVCELEDCCMATLYLRMARGEYAAFKDGRRTVIPGAAILARRHNRLTRAKFKAPPLPPPARFHTIRRSA